MQLTTIKAIGVAGWSAAIGAAALTADLHTRWMWSIVAVVALFPPLLLMFQGNAPAPRLSTSGREANGW